MSQNVSKCHISRTWEILPRPEIGFTVMSKNFMQLYLDRANCMFSGDVDLAVDMTALMNGDPIWQGSIINKPFPNKHIHIDQLKSKN